MEAERVVPDLPGTTPFAVAPGAAGSTPMFSAGTSRGLDHFLWSDGLEDASATESLFSADARTEQVFFGNFLPVSNGLRRSFMRRCPSAPSELSAADQQRLLQQQRLHVHLLQLERKVSMQERLLCQVQKSGELPLLMQHQLTATERTGSSDKLHGALPCPPQVQFGTKKRQDEADKSELLSSPHTTIFSEKRCLSLAELPSLSLPTHQGSLSIADATGDPKGMNCAALRTARENTTYGTPTVKAETADDGTPSTAVATAADHSPASDKRTSAPHSEGIEKTVDSAVALTEANIDCRILSEQVNTRENSLLAASLHGEDTTVGSSCVSPARRTSEKAGEEEKEEHPREGILWQQSPAADGEKENQNEKEEGEALDGDIKTRTSESIPTQKPKEQKGESIDRASETCQKKVEKEAADAADPSSTFRAVVEAGKGKKTVGEADSSLLVPNGRAEKEYYEGAADAAGGRKLECMRPPDQFFRIKLCAKYLRRTCRKGSHCSYAHAEEELREIPNLRKTKLCATHKMGKPCPLETACPFAHGEEELRCTAEYYKTKLCKFWTRERRCEAGEGCRHAHGVAELRQRTHRYADFVKASLPDRSQENQQAPEATSRMGTRPKDVGTPVTPVTPLASPPRESPSSGKRTGAGAMRAAKAENHKAFGAGSGSKCDRSSKLHGQTEERHVRAGETPSPHNEGESGVSRRWNDAVQGHGACDQRSCSKTHRKGQGEGEHRVSGMRGRARRGGGAKGPAMRQCENAVPPSTYTRERTASALGTATRVFPRPGGGPESRRDSGGKELGRRLGHGALHQQHHLGGGREGERKDSYLQSPVGKRRGTCGSHGAQHTSQSYYGSREKKGQAHSLPGFAVPHEQAEAALHTQRSHMQHQQTHLHHHQKLPMHLPESSALSMTSANTSALYGLTAGINPYGALAACQQQAPYGLSLLPTGPPSCGNMPSAAAAAAAVAAIAQQQQQLEAAAKAVGSPVYQNMPFLGPPFGAPFAPSPIPFAAPPHALPAFAAGAVAAAGSAAARSCAAAYAASYPTYPYSSPGAPPLVGEASGAGPATCLPTCYPRGMSVPCSAYTYDARRPEVCMQPNRGDDLQPDRIQTDACEPEQAGERYISQGSDRSMTAAAIGFPLRSTAFGERASPHYPAQWGQEDGIHSIYREDCGTYSDTSASP